MKRGLMQGLMAGFLCLSAQAQDIEFDQYPSAVITNDEIVMRVFLPDPENGFYRGARFDWSGVIGSLRYRGHEFFGPWRETHDPSDPTGSITGPAEGFIKAGLGYDEAATGEGFVRIGIGVLKKNEEPYHFRNAYEFLDYGRWSVEQGDDHIVFQHELETDFGYAYVYEKTVRLTDGGFTLEHELRNTGEKIIETDQFNHNFFVIDGDKTGSDFVAEFPFPISTDRDTRDMARLETNSVHYTQNPIERSLLLSILGYSDDPGDHQVTIRNTKSGAGIMLKGDQPLIQLMLWANPNALCPEPFIQITVEPGASMHWTTQYTVLADNEQVAASRH